MYPYPKINSVFKRNPTNGHKTLIEGDFATPEFEYLQRCKWQATEKVDGVNIRVNIWGKFVTFLGKTDKAEIPPPLLSHLHSVFREPGSAIDPPAGPQLALHLRNISPHSIYLYGEGYGPKINDGGKYSPTAKFVLFDVRINDVWLTREAMEELAAKLSIPVVPIVITGPLYDLLAMTREGFPSKWGDFTAEGLVARPVVELRDRRGYRIITKMKHRDYNRKEMTYHGPLPPSGKHSPPNLGAAND